MMERLWSGHKPSRASMAIDILSSQSKRPPHVDGIFSESKTFLYGRSEGLSTSSKYITASILKIIEAC